MPVQHFVNPGKLYATGTQPQLAPPSECVCSFLQTGCCTAPHCLARHPDKKTNVTLTFDLDTQYDSIEFVKVRVRAKFHQAKCSGS